MSFLDTIFAKKKITQAKIVDKIIIPSFIYDSLSTYYVGKSLVFVPTKAIKEEQYEIKLDFNNQIKNLTINKKQYDQLQLDSIVIIEYKIGLFTNEIYTKKIVQ